MRKIILIVPVSLDGFIEGPQRDLDWHKVDDELHRQFQRAARRDGLCRATTRRCSL
jgi:dihydrofolate reductase